MRTKELTGMICGVGCDEVEATTNSVAVQQMPEEERKRIGRTSTLQSNFEGSVLGFIDKIILSNRINRSQLDE